MNPRRANRERIVTVAIKADLLPFVQAMQRVAATMQRITPAVQRITHRLARHRPEIPARSAMHAAYDRKRRARRRRGRR